MQAFCRDFFWYGEPCRSCVNTFVWLKSAVWLKVIASFAIFWLEHDLCIQKNSFSSKRTTKLSSLYSHEKSPFFHFMCFIHETLDKVPSESQFIYNNCKSDASFHSAQDFLEWHSTTQTLTTRTHTPMNTRTQTLPLWAPLKDWAPADLEIPEVTSASSSTGTSLTT
jgi:hypothetical protein